MSYSPGRGAVAQWRPIFRFTRATCWLHNTLVRLWFTQTLCSSVLIGQYLLDKKRVDWSVFSCRENTDQSNTDISDLFGKEVVDSKVASLKNMVGEKWRREGRGSKRVHNYSIYGSVLDGTRGEQLYPQLDVHNLNQKRGFYMEL